MGEVSEGNQAWHRLLAWWQGMVRQSICLPGSACLRRRLGALAMSSKFASWPLSKISVEFSTKRKIAPPNDEVRKFDGKGTHSGWIVPGSSFFILRRC
eukprot:scaffold7947_cov101-Isochrysis_galbana.AAC.1